MLNPFCSACSSHVKAALSKIDGVQSVKITTADKGGLPKLKITSTKPLTREIAIQALGLSKSDPFALKTSLLVIKW